MQLQKQDEHDLKYSEKLFNEANERLKAAITKKDLDEAGIAQCLMDAARNKMKEVRVHMVNNRKRKDELNKKQKRLIDDYSKKLNIKKCNNNA